jgi:subtilase family serine protease
VPSWLYRGASCWHFLENPQMFRSFAPKGGAYMVKQSRMLPALEALEGRVVPSTLGTVPLAFTNVRLLSSPLAQGSYPVQPAASATPAGGYSPSQFAQAYGFNQISFGSVKGDGAGQTIAIIDAYDDPTIASDLATFDSALGIPAPPSFTKVNQTGGTSYPSGDSGWGVETSLDVEWAHGMAPGANILLVEANSNVSTDLYAAIDYARNQPGVSVLSMSWGTNEFYGEGSYDSYFTTPSGHAGVAFVAASGDSGSSGAPLYPSVAPEVLAVGGTNLRADSFGDYLSETGWTSSSGGISTYEQQPGYQSGVVTQSSTRRTTPDVAYNAGTAMGIYDTYNHSGWINVGGTSAGAPQWAALIAIADQGRALAGQSSLDGFSQALPKLYQLSQSDFHDITTGSNGSYTAGPGYDLVTGRGTPYANLIVSALIGAPTSGSGPSVATSASATPNPVTNTTANLSVLGSDPAGESTLTYTWAVVSEPAGATVPTYSVNGTNAAKNTTATFSLAGNYTFQATIQDASGLTATSSVGVTVNQTFTSVGVSPTTITVMQGNSQQFTATTLDQFGHPMATQPSSFTWSLGTGSVGTVTSAGLYQAPLANTGTATVIASSTMSGSATVTVAAQVPIPAAPTNLVASTVSKTQVNLSWSESASSVTGYNIQRSSNGGKGWVQLAQVTTTSYSDTTVSGGKTYLYRVDASDSAGSSAWTTSGKVMTPKVIVLDSSVSTNLSGSSTNQNALASGSGSIASPSANILDYFLASPSNGSSGQKQNEPLTSVVEPAQETGPAIAGASAPSRIPAPATDAPDLFGQLAE